MSSPKRATIEQVKSEFAMSPDVANGTVEIVAVAGEFGGWLKIAIRSRNHEVHAENALVRRRGSA